MNKKKDKKKRVKIKRSSTSIKPTVKKQNKAEQCSSKSKSNTVISKPFLTHHDSGYDGSDSNNSQLSGGAIRVGGEYGHDASDGRLSCDAARALCPSPPNTPWDVYREYDKGVWEWQDEDDMIIHNEQTEYIKGDSYSERESDIINSQTESKHEGDNSHLLLQKTSLVSPTDFKEGKDGDTIDIVIDSPVANNRGSPIKNIIEDSCLLEHGDATLDSFQRTFSSNDDLILPSTTPEIKIDSTDWSEGNETYDNFYKDRNQYALPDRQFSEKSDVANNSLPSMSAEVLDRNHDSGFSFTSVTPVYARDKSAVIDNPVYVGTGRNNQELNRTESSETYEDLRLDVSSCNWRDYENEHNDTINYETENNNACRTSINGIVQDNNEEHLETKTPIVSAQNDQNGLENEEMDGDGSEIDCIDTSQKRSGKQRNQSNKKEIGKYTEDMKLSGTFCKNSKTCEDCVDRCNKKGISLLVVKGSGRTTNGRFGMTGKSPYDFNKRFPGLPYDTQQVCSPRKKHIMSPRLLGTTAMAQHSKHLAGKRALNVEGYTNMELALAVEKWRTHKRHEEERNGNMFPHLVPVGGRNQQNANNWHAIVPKHRRYDEMLGLSVESSKLKLLHKLSPRKPDSHLSHDGRIETDHPLNLPKAEPTIQLQNNGVHQNNFNSGLRPSLRAAQCYAKMMSRAKRAGTDRFNKPFKLPQIKKIGNTVLAGNLLSLKPPAADIYKARMDLLAVPEPPPTTPVSHPSTPECDSLEEEPAPVEVPARTLVIKLPHIEQDDSDSGDEDDTEEIKFNSSDSSTVNRMSMLTLNNTGKKTRKKNSVDILTLC